MLTCDKIIKLLDLKPHPDEGGFFKETYRSDEIIKNISDRYNGQRTYGTCIYYLLTPDTFSSIHKLNSDEIFHFYIGDAVEMLQLFPDGNGKIITIGNDLESGIMPQVIVPMNVWQGSRLKKGGQFALLGTTVAPGFEYQDYENGKRNELISSYPEFFDLIINLTIE